MTHEHMKLSSIESDQCSTEISTLSVDRQLLSGLSQASTSASSCEAFQASNP